MQNKNFTRAAARSLPTFLDPAENPKGYVHRQLVHWNVEKLVKIFNGTIVRPFHIVWRQTKLNKAV